jgi:tetratricopeptide (TPR) repeat protein
MINTTTLSVEAGHLHSAWLRSWMDTDPSLPIPADRLMSTCGALVQPILHADPSDAMRATLEDVASVVEGALALHPDHGRLRSIGSGLARRVGREDDAVRWAEEGELIDSSMVSACMLGYAHRAAGDEERAFAAFAVASERAPADPDPRLDAADSLAALGEWVRAAEWAESALHMDPERGTAAGRALYARYRATGDHAAALSLLDWLESRWQGGDVPESLGDAALIASSLVPELPWLAHIPVPANAAVNIARQVFEQEGAPSAPSGRTALTMSAPEAPSALLALSHTVRGGLDVTTTDIPEPDPRRPRRKVRTLSWRLAGDELVAAVDPPNAPALSAMRLTEAPWYRLTTAEDDARSLAATGVSDADLVALAVHPSPGPSTVVPWEWIRRWEVVCCLALAERGSFQVLCDLADGPEDWICDAALAGLLALARRQPKRRKDVLAFATAHLKESTRRLHTLDLPHYGSECDLFVLLPGRAEVDARAAMDLKALWLESYS